MRPEVIMFIAAQTNLSNADRARELAESQYHIADQDFRAAWGKLTAAEKNKINKATEKLAS